MAAESIHPKTWKQRNYSANAYVDPIRDTWEKVLLEKPTSSQDATAKGVQLTSKDGATQTISARKEVIISAGAIHSPRPLEESPPRRMCPDMCMEVEDSLIHAVYLRPGHANLALLLPSTTISQYREIVGPTTSTWSSIRGCGTSRGLAILANFMQEATQRLVVMRILNGCCWVECFHPHLFSIRNTSPGKTYST